MSLLFTHRNLVMTPMYAFPKHNFQITPMYAPLLSLPKFIFCQATFSYYAKRNA